MLARAEDLPLPPQPDEQPRPGPTTNKSTTKSSTSGSSSGTKVPRWLKLGPSGYFKDHNVYSRYVTDNHQISRVTEYRRVFHVRIQVGSL